MLPPVNLRPQFNITRVSHVVLIVSNLAKSRDYYVNVIGLIVTEESNGVCYLRGLAEACHHSLVLIEAAGAPICKRIGMRVFFEEELEVAFHYFRSLDLPAEWVDVPHQGRTLHVTDPFGIKLELCARMETVPRLHLRHDLFKGAKAQNLDHYQILAPNAYRACEFYSGLGFRTSEYLTHGDKLIGAFMYRKGLALDLAIVENIGPRLHHFAYTLPESADLFAACDAAAMLGYASSVERGPGRHGPSGVLFLYLRDPDGHRVEVFTHHYQTIDIETESVRWEAASLNTNVHWGLPAPHRWYFEASNFEGSPLVEPEVMPKPETLELYVQKLLDLP